MTATTEVSRTAVRAAKPSLFDRVIVGVDGGEPGFEACRQAAVLAPADAQVEAVSVVYLADAVHAGLNAARIAEMLQRDAEAALDQAVDILGERAQRRFLNGFVTEGLLQEIARFDATAIVIGTHGHRRANEILIGGVAGELLHRAPCSVLVARAPADPAAFPRAIVVGIDGSPQSDTALAAAQQLTRRFDVPLRVLVASGGKDVDLARVHLRAPLAEKLDDHPVKALVDASRSADILVVGSRGLHGLRALGSVSERVAHRAACSVLVTRA